MVPANLIVCLRVFPLLQLANRIDSRLRQVLPAPDVILYIHWFQTLIPLEAVLHVFEQSFCIVVLHFAVDEGVVSIEVVAVQHFQEGDFLSAARPMDPDVDVHHLKAEQPHERKVDGSCPGEVPILLILLLR